MKGSMLAAFVMIAGAVPHSEAAEFRVVEKLSVRGGITVSTSATASPLLFISSVTNPGNVGIGTTFPQGSLEIRQSPAVLRMRNDVAAQYAEVDLISDNGKDILIHMLGSANVGTTLGMPNANGTRIYSTGDWLALYAYGAAPLLLGTNNAERMRIDSSGNVGIGTLTPSATLEVNGNVIANTPTASNHLATKGYVDAAGGGKTPKVQTFTSNGTWTRPSGVDVVWVTLVGGGGGGGGAYWYLGGGGGGGGQAIIKYPYQVTGNVSVTVGAGGTAGAANGSGGAGGNSSFGTLTALGGSGTSASYSSTGLSGGASGGSALGGAGGSAAGVNGSNGMTVGGDGLGSAGGGGGGGGNNFGNSGATTFGGAGGGSGGFSGGKGGYASSTGNGGGGGGGGSSLGKGGDGGQGYTAAGSNGSGYGAGGGGGSAYSGAGGAGSSGVVILEWWE